MQDFDLFRIDGHTLNVFVSVCETGSISRTADVFDLNQSTISHTIDKLRAAVKDPLFVKSGRGITPTEKALAILPRVQRILTEVEGLVEAEEYKSSLDTKPVVVAISTPALLRDMQLFQSALIKASPHYTFEIRRLAPRERINDMLTEDEADIVIAVSGFRYPRTLDHCVYGHDTLAVFYDPEVREAPSTLEAYRDARHGTVNFGGTTKSEVERVLADMGIKRDIGIVSPTASMLGDLIKGTPMIATMPARLAGGVYADLAHCPPPLELGGISYDLVWHRRYEHSGRNRWLRQTLMNATREIYAVEK